MAACPFQLACFILFSLIHTDIRWYKVLHSHAHIFLHRQLDFPSEPGVSNEILENEPKSCLAVA